MKGGTTSPFQIGAAGSSHLGNLKSRRLYPPLGFPIHLISVTPRVTFIDGKVWEPLLQPVVTNPGCCHHTLVPDASFPRASSILEWGLGIGMFYKVPRWLEGASKVEWKDFIIIRDKNLAALLICLWHVQVWNYSLQDFYHVRASILGSEGDMAMSLTQFLLFGFAWGCKQSCFA